MQGIYKITNIQTGRIYVGSSFNITLRWKTHVEDLEKKDHCNILMQRDYDAYGLESFEFKIVKDLSGMTRPKMEIEEKLVLDTVRRDLMYNINVKVVKTKKKRITSLTSIILKNKKFKEYDLKMISTVYQIPFKTILTVVDKLVKSNHLILEDKVYTVNKELKGKKCTMKSKKFNY